MHGIIVFVMHLNGLNVHLCGTMCPMWNKSGHFFCKVLHRLKLSQIVHDCLALNLNESGVGNHSLPEYNQSAKYDIKIQIRTH